MKKTTSLFESVLNDTEAAATAAAAVKEEVDIEPTKSEPLGLPLPRDEHACSVSLPSWASVVGYEEGDEKITSSMRCGYPRFVYHPLILQLMNVVVDKYGSKDNNNKEDCLLLPGYAAAVRCQAFLQQALKGPTTTHYHLSQDDSSRVDNALLCVDHATATAGAAVNKADSLAASSRIRIVALEKANVHAVLFPAETQAGMQAKAYWQHTGEIVSSRRAEEALRALGIPIQRQVTCGPQAPYICHPASNCTGSGSSRGISAGATNDDPFSSLRESIAKWAQVPSPDSVFLTPSGMASIYTCLRSSRRYQIMSYPSPRNLGGRSIVFGFPYLDTLKMCSRAEFCPGGVDFFGYGNQHDLNLLEQVLEHQTQKPFGNNRVCALFTEVPSNPLLQCPDLYALRQLADQYDFCLIVDDTIGNFLNIDMINTGIADAVCTSLTKIVSGRGDAMAGSVVTNPNTEKGRWLQKDLQREYCLDNNCGNDTAMGLAEADANALLCNSRDFVERNEKINYTSEILADWLKDHADVETVYYPKYASLYPSLLSSRSSADITVKAGYGGLMSILLESNMCQRTFYDSLDVAKGPSLGTNFTLVCPYTLLAHYHELDFAMSYNVPPNLLRIAVGLEDVDVLKNKFEQAFDLCRLYPKLTTSQHPTTTNQQKRAYSTLQFSSSLRATRNLAATTRYGASLQSNTTMMTALRRMARCFPR